MPAETRAREVAKSVTQIGRDISDIKKGLTDIEASPFLAEWMVGFTLAFVVAFTRRVSR